VLTTMGLLAFAPAPLTRTTSHRRAARLPCPTLEFGDNYYEGALEPLPEGVYEVAIKTPLGIQFEEDGPIIGKSGVSVIALVDGGNAAKGTSIYANSGGTNMGKEGKVEVGDKRETLRMTLEPKKPPNTGVFSHAAVQRASRQLWGPRRSSSKELSGNGRCSTAANGISKRLSTRSSPTRSSSTATMSFSRHATVEMLLDKPTAL
jgi:hypothetical protein